MDPIKQLATDLHNNKGPVLVVTGAGISLASGIPTFRGTDPGAVWKRDVTELGTVRYFRDEPEGSWSWYLQRFSALHNAQPNPGHNALVELEAWCDAQKVPFLLVTQNVDGLHAAAGSRELVEVHGAARRVRCARFGCTFGAPSGSIARADIEDKITAFLADPVRDKVPRCPECDSFLRQHVLWFDEFYTEHESYQWNRVVRASEVASLVIFIGTSFSVGVTELVASAARRLRIPTYNMDPASTPMRNITLIPEGAEKALPTLMTELRAWF